MQTKFLLSQIKKKIHSFLVSYISKVRFMEAVPFQILSIALSSFFFSL